MRGENALAKLVRGQGVKGPRGGDRFHGTLLLGGCKGKPPTKSVTRPRAPLAVVKI